MHLSTCYNYKAHTIYTDGRLYKADELAALENDRSSGNTGATD